MSVRPVEPDDGPALRSFLSGVPEEDASFLKEDLSDADVVDGWLRADRVLRMVYVADDGIAGVASIAGGVGRSDHVAELRVVVDARRRRGGIGRALAEQALLAAVRAGYRKVTVEVGSTQRGVQELFAGLGFTPEALHIDQIRADDGQFLDILELAHLVEDNWSAMAAVGQGVTQ